MRLCDFVAFCMFRHIIYQVTMLYEAFSYSDIMDLYQDLSVEYSILTTLNQNFHRHQLSPFLQVANFNADSCIFYICYYGKNTKVVEIRIPKAKHCESLPKLTKE